jgi:hypothetical protein
MKQVKKIVKYFAYKLGIIQEVKRETIVDVGRRLYLDSTLFTSKERANIGNVLMIYGAYLNFHGDLPDNLKVRYTTDEFKDTCLMLDENKKYFDKVLLGIKYKSLSN